MLSLVPWILVISDVEPRPAVESAALDVAEAIRRRKARRLVFQRVRAPWYRRCDREIARRRWCSRRRETEGRVQVGRTQFQMVCLGRNLRMFPSDLVFRRRRYRAEL